jgi:hypothetical protein
MKEIISIVLQAADAQGFSMCSATPGAGGVRAEAKGGW